METNGVLYKGIIWSLLVIVQFLMACVQGNNNPNKDYSNKTPVVNGNNIFRSEENFYRIKIPTGWKIAKGNSLGAEFNAESELGDASLSIVVATMENPPKFTAHDVPVVAVMNAIKKNNETSQFLESGKQYLSNEKALYVKYKMNYKTTDIDVDIISIQYSVIKDIRIFTITLQAQEDNYPMYQKIFQETLQSFMFENFK